MDLLAWQRGPPQLKGGERGMSAEPEFEGFDLTFDDTEWTERWLDVAIAQVPADAYPGGYRVERRTLHEVEVFGQPYRVAMPLDCGFLYDPDGQLWMSNTPQERIMMYNNGRRSWGNVLVGGLGLGLYPQYAALGAAGEATRFTIVERSPAVRDIVEPTLRSALRVPLEVQAARVEDVLSGPAAAHYDTIFIDTWATLDATRLPAINRLRDLALRHLTADGQVLLWGYRWMVRLFEQACRQLLQVPPAQRRSWLTARAGASPEAIALLAPVVDHFEERPVGNLDAALDWCRRYVVQVSA
jgi:hypothetical protein